MRTTLQTIRDFLVIVIGCLVTSNANAQAAAATPTASPDPQTQAALYWVWGFVGVAVAANALFALWRNLTGHLKVEPDPAATYQTRADCKANHAADHCELDKFATEIRAALAAHDRKAEERASGSHRRIDALVEIVHQTRGQVENHIEHHPGVST